MGSASRIPEVRKFKVRNISAWFSKMSARDLLFHPDDDPADIIEISSGRRLFSADEVVRLRRILGEMFSRQGNGVYEVAYPVFMRRFHGRMPLIYG